VRLFLRWRIFPIALLVSACNPGGVPVTDVPTTLVQDITTSAASTPSDAIEIVDNMPGPLEPGEYWIDHDGDPGTSLRVDFTIAGPGWEPVIGVFKEARENNYVNVLFAAVTRIASAACQDTEWLPAGQTALEVANGIADIDDFVTREPLTDITAFGYDGYHLVLEIPEGDYYDADEGFVGCDDPNNPGGFSFDGWEGPTLSRYYQGPGQIVEYWVLDVEGTPLLIESSRFRDSPEADIAELQEILGSIAITP
jgi:hypothetical protein